MATPRDPERFTPSDGPENKKPDPPRQLGGSNSGGQDRGGYGGGGYGRGGQENVDRGGFRGARGTAPNSGPGLERDRSSRR